MKGVVALVFASLLSACAAADLSQYQADPLTVAPPSSPNWALAAPAEASTAATPTASAPIFATGPEELLGYLDAVAAAEPRVETLEPNFSDGPLARAYVQRSATVGFPDVISISAVDLGVGDAGQRSSLALYSRSVYGYSDLGVNAERLERWIAALSETAPVVAGRETAAE